MITLLWLFVLLLLCAVFARRMRAQAEAGDAPSLRLSDLWRPDGELDRGAYALWGFLLFALKHNIDRFVAWTWFGQRWGPFNYLDKGAASVELYMTLALLCLPFVWAGMALTLKRLRSIGLPAALSALFFVPVVNLLFFLLLSLIPKGDNKQAPAHGLSRLAPETPWGAAALGVGLTAAGGLALAALSISVLGRYGWGLFVGLPFCMGLLSTLIYGCRQRRSLAACLAVATASVTLAGALIFAVMIEGAVCLAMAWPLAAPLAWMGAAVGYLLQRRVLPEALACVLALPLLMAADWPARRAEPVTTRVVIDAPAAKVWGNVVSFAELPAPRHWLFKLGFAYPVRATIEGRGPGAIRRCTFSTGDFVEPIEVWDEPRLLRFGVTAQPAPMRETFLFGSGSVPHLDGFLVSERGEFRLTALPNGRTLLEGTTWYRHRMEPDAYWRPWSDFIIHRIHERVLDHIKSLSEAA